MIKLLFKLSVPYNPIDAATDPLAFQDQDHWQQIHIIDDFIQYDIKTEHFVSSSIQCQICQEYLPSKEFLLYHCELRHQSYVVLESIESLITKTEENVGEKVKPIKSRKRKRKRTIPQEILFVCEHCNTGFFKESFYLLHKEKLMCKHYTRCEGLNCLPLHLINHKKQHYKCKDCLKCWGNRHDLLVHHKTDHEEKNPIYKCQDCNMEYFKESALLWHRKKLPCRYYILCEGLECLPNNNKRHYKCKGCEKCFLAGRETVRH